MSKNKKFTENAKGFLSSWKDDYADKNKDIIERKKKRDEETEELKQKIFEQFEEIKTDFKGIAKDIYDNLNHEFKCFLTAVEEGTATVTKKLELEKRLEQMKMFLEATGDKSAVKFNKIANEMKSKLSDFDIELPSKKVNSIENNTNKNHDNIKKLFGDV